jgi:hypothetical protein
LSILEVGKTISLVGWCGLRRDARRVVASLTRSRPRKTPPLCRLCENWGESGREGRIDNDAVFFMSYIRGEDREQASFLPARIDDYVGTEAAVRVIDAFAEGLNVVGLGFVRAVPAATGRPGYDPRDLLKLYVYGCSGT